MPKLDDSSVNVARGSDLDLVDQTAGMDRLKAFDTDETMVFRLEIDGDETSDWHHHGDHHVFGYLVEGRGRWEYGSSEEDTVTVDAGDFWHIPPRTIHRDINPYDEPQTAIVFIYGSGPLAVDVAGPDADVVLE